MRDYGNIFSSELEWLRWYAQNVDFGPADGDINDSMRCAFMKEFGKLPARGWNYWSSGEEITYGDFEDVTKKS